MVRFAIRKLMPILIMRSEISHDTCNDQYGVDYILLKGMNECRGPVENRENPNVKKDKTKGGCRPFLEVLRYPYT